MGVCLCICLCVVYMSPWLCLPIYQDLLTLMWSIDEDCILMWSSDKVCIIGLESLAAGRYQLVTRLPWCYVCIVAEWIGWWPSWYMVTCSLVDDSSSAWWYSSFLGSHSFELPPKVIAWYYECDKVVWFSDSDIFKGVVCDIYHLVCPHSFGYSLDSFLLKVYILFIICFHLVCFCDDLFHWHRISSWHKSM